MTAAKILIKNCISTLVFCVGFFYCVLPVYVRFLRNDKDKFAFVLFFCFLPMLLLHNKKPHGWNKNLNTGFKNKINIVALT